MVVKKIIAFSLFTFMLVSLFLVSCSSGSTVNVAEELRCSVDSDCVAALCCHSDSAVNKEFAPDCSGILCTASCEPNTMDCGQAVAKCIDYACTVVQVE